MFRRKLSLTNNITVVICSLLKYRYFLVMFTVYFFHVLYHYTFECSSGKSSDLPRNIFKLCHLHCRNNFFFLQNFTNILLSLAFLMLLILLQSLFAYLRKKCSISDLITIQKYSLVMFQVILHQTKFYW